MRVFEFVKTEFLRGFTPEEEPPGAEEEEDASDDELASTENASPADASHIEVRSLPELLLMKPTRCDVQSSPC